MTRWITPSRCNSGYCVGVTFTHDGRVNVRDEHGVVIELRPDAWLDALYEISAGRLPMHVAETIGGGFEWTGVPPRTGNDPVVLRYTGEEWREFEDAARRGEFDLDRLQAAAR